MTESTRWRILIIDDEKDIREVLALSLADMGYAVETAAEGLSGMEVTASFAPHIVVTDIRMPGLDGLQVLERIKHQFPTIEVIVATAFAQMELAVRALRLDASDFITKPIDHEALAVAIERAKQRIDLRRQAHEYTRFLEEGWNDTTRELIAAFNYQNQLIESSMDGILGCDETEKVVLYNHSMQDLLGYAKTEVVHKFTLSDFFSSQDLTLLRQCRMQESMRKRTGQLLHETLLTGKQGLSIPVQLSAAVIQGDDRPTGLVCFIRDLRKLRRLELQMADQARILHQDKMISLGRLAASVAHEINNPLAGVLNYLRLMQRLLERGLADTEQSTKFRHYLTVSEQEVDRCSHIVSDLLSFSRPSDRPYVRISVGPLLERCVTLCRHRLDLSQIHLTVRAPAHLPQVNGNANQIVQCLINLLFNALDAMPNGGELVLSAEHDVDNHSVLLQVTDTGSGIAAEDQEHLFEPFFSTKPEGRGTGLGLSTAYAIVQQHGGTLTLQSRVGQGTTFFIRFPAMENSDDALPLATPSNSRSREV